MVAKYKNSKDFYKRNPDKAKIKSNQNNSNHPDNEFAHTDEYKRKHANARLAALKIGSVTKNQDMTTQANGSLKPGNRRNNRIAGAKKGASRRAG
tara:strand:+ start:234 stop:518 length:285 start_codon:yes stop_codon:yes gene_type:complete